MLLYSGLGWFSNVNEKQNIKGILGSGCITLLILLHLLVCDPEQPLMFRTADNFGVIFPWICKLVTKVPGSNPTMGRNVFLALKSTFQSFFNYSNLS